MGAEPLRAGVQYEAELTRLPHLEVVSAEPTPHQHTFLERWMDSAFLERLANSKHTSMQAIAFTGQVIPVAIELCRTPSDAAETIRDIVLGTIEQIQEIRTNGRSLEENHGN